MYLKNSKIIVVKIGSSLLIDDNKKIRNKWLSEFAKDIKELIKKNRKVIIVSSGAIAMGCKKLNINKRNLKIKKIIIAIILISITLLYFAKLFL